MHLYSFAFRLLLVTTVLCCSLPAQGSDRFALVIGNSDYRVKALPNPVNDARGLTAALRKLGFQVDLHEDLEHRGIKNAISRFTQKLTSDSVALFFFAGHGLQVDGRNYIVPLRASPQTLADVEYEFFGVDRILAQFEEARSALNIIVLDCCRDEPETRSWGLRSSMQSGFVGMDAPEGSLIAFSTAPGAVAKDGKKGGNSPFAESLMRILGTQDPAGMTLIDLFIRTSKRVKAMTAGEQVPWFGGADLTVLDYCLVPPSSNSVSTSSSVASKSGNVFELSQPTESNPSQGYITFGSPLSEEELQEYYAPRSVVIRNGHTNGSLHIRSKGEWTIGPSHISRFEWSKDTIRGALGAPGVHYFDGAAWQWIPVGPQANFAVEFQVNQSNGQPRWVPHILSTAPARWNVGLAPVLNQSPGKK